MENPPIPQRGNYGGRAYLLQFRDGEAVMVPPLGDRGIKAQNGDKLTSVTAIPLQRAHFRPKGLSVRRFFPENSVQYHK